MAYTAAVEEGDLRSRGHAFDNIMSAPASGLVRNRGGRSKTVSRLKTALRNSLSRASAWPSDVGQRTEESLLWKAKLARVVELANKGNLFSESCPHAGLQLELLLRLEQNI